MNFDLTDEQTMICDSAERLIRELGALERRRERIARGEGFDRDLWSQSAELGWLALCVPEDAGGLGGSITDIALLMIELGRGMASDPLISSAILCSTLLAGSDWEGRADWIEQIMSGNGRLAFANLEPGDRAEWPAPRGTTLKAEGNGFVLNGAKLLVQDGEGADGYIVTASIPGEQSQALLFVPADAEGLIQDHYRLIDGSRAADLRFDHAPISGGQVIGRGDGVAALLEDAIARASVATLASAIGSMEACLDICSDYLKTRQQFGQPIGKFQALQHMMTDMLVTTHNARSNLYHLLSRMDGDRDERAAALASARLAIGQAGLSVGRTGVQLHGGYGVTDEYVISHHYRYLMALEKRFGDSQAYGAMLADQLFGPIAA